MLNLEWSDMGLDDDPPLSTLWPWGNQKTMKAALPRSRENCSTRCAPWRCSMTRNGRQRPTCSWMRQENHSDTTWCGTRRRMHALAQEWLGCCSMICGAVACAISGVRAGHIT